MSRGTLVIIAGPTAVGKTAVGIELCRLVGGEVLTADSMQVYRYMDIGTAKPTLAERKGVPHHLIDLVNPDEPFSVARYQQLARAAIDDVFDRGRVPVIVGGTGLYIRSVIDSYEFTPGEPDTGFRMQMQAREASEPRSLYQWLSSVDPAAAAKIHPNDLRRIIRALEVFVKTGRPISLGWRREPLPYDVLYFGLTGDREWLYRRIDARVREMLRCGLVEEVRRLLEMGYDENLAPMQSLGYKESIWWLKGRATMDEAAGMIARNTRRFAKRQYTWFRADHRIEWIDVGKPSGITQAVEDIARHVEGRAWHARE